uniref:Uncharacterized protein n=1 Tax=Rhodnius prolixus TaxID=13249 RepID=T1I8X0_RHOPR
MQKRGKLAAPRLNKFCKVICDVYLGTPTLQRVYSPEQFKVPNFQPFNPYLNRMKQCVFIIDDRTQSMPIQSVVDVEAISSSTCIISTTPAADVLTPSLIHSAAFILLRS